jgi:hypothetical protein
MVKRIALALALALSATIPGLAGDLPSRRAGQNERVKTCDEYGAGFVRGAATDTCVKVSGSVQVEVGASGSTGGSRRR